MVVRFQKKLCLQLHKIEERNYLDEEIDFPSWKKKKNTQFHSAPAVFPFKGMISFIHF